MKRAALVLLFGLPGILAAADTPPSHLMSPPDRESMLERWLGKSSAGVAVAYVDDRGVTFSNAGTFSSDDPRPITPDTEFEIGSVTKVFTALLLADGVRAGKIALDAPIGAPFSPSRITFLQLATHTSGLPRLPQGFSSSDPANPYVDKNLPDLIKAFDLAAIRAQPSPTSVYSNFGFAVLGQAVAGAWGRSYPELMRERVLGPLGLSDTKLSWRDADPSRVAPGHRDQDAVPHWDFNAYAPAGALVSTARNLATFLQACLGFRQTPLNEALADCVQPRVPGARPGLKNGLAWIVAKTGEETLVWHNGETGGFHSFIAFDPARRVGVVVLTNQARSVDALGAALLRGRELPAARVAAPPTASVRDYPGRYPLSPAFVITITADGDTLWLQATHQPRLKLRRLAADRFKVEGVEAEITFERGGGQRVESLVLHQNGRDQRAPHLPPATD